ncbi:MAG: DUF692 family protein, partial [Pseudomonadota bacterium]|nr:DUF692 family protein [Pseudomonadota bacterium]
ADAVAEYHLAGATKHNGCWVDTHSTAVSNEVWALYEIALQQMGPRPTLIEWDNDIPELALLLNEATKAQQQMGRFNETLV